MVKALGEGDNGYGPSRARESIELTDRPGERLLAVAETLRDRGALAAYARLTDRGDCRVFNLGPAFGTKYLYFTQPTSHRPQALIWDKNIAHWFHTHAGVPRFTAWSLRRYTVFLSQMHAWAEALRCEPDEVELCMFRSALNSSNQWKDD